MSVELLFLLGFLLILSFPTSFAETLTCMAVYKEGGAPAVFQSPKCPRWTLPADAPRHPPKECQVAVFQGRRRSQEDRAICALDIRIPFLGRRGVKDIRVGIVAVFDGHNGADASDLASKLILEYFFLHVYFLLDGIYSVALKKSAEKLTYGAEHNAILQVLKLDKHESWQKLGQDRFEWMSSTIFDEAFHLEILKESLVRTIHDIDVTFSKEALKLNLESGSTATVVLIANGHILTANVGDSKAFLCSKGFDSLLGKGSKSKLNRGRRRKDLMTTINTYGDFKMTNYGGSGYYVKELTKDHHLARDDERDRVEASGGYVVEWAGVLRVNGELALSRAIGDVQFKRYGVIPVPEVTDWQYLTKNDSFLVAASDGIFEKMTTQEVCDVLWDEKSTFSSPLWCVHDLSCADCIVNNAFDRGSMDNLAAVVVPLESGCIFQHLMQGHHEGDEIGTSLISSHYYKKMISKFDRLLIEANNKRLGCFYLSENLNDDMDYVFQVPKHVSDNDFGNFDPTLQEPHPSVGPLDIYSDQSFCWHIGFYEGDNGQCTSPNVFTEFLGLIDSAPFNDTKSNYTKSYSHKVPDLRYRLKRRFDRGSYGEVWLAFHWNCSEEHDASDPVHRIQACSASIPQLNTGEYDENPCMGPSEACQRNLSTVPSFILKRIMVERGTGAYLSGLREKYFGEVFLNASTSLRDTEMTGFSTSFSLEEEIQSSKLIWNNITDKDDVESRSYNSNTEFKNFKTARVMVEAGLEHIARFVESFESDLKEIWLVFRNEGISLSKLIYTSDEMNSLNNDGRDEHANRIRVLHPSTWWYWLRTTVAGQKEMQSLIWQLLLALKSCHDRSITHRDIKPENMIICFEEVETGKCSRDIPIGSKHHIKMRIIDFGSAIDEFTLKHFYGSGPTRSEQTFEYTPPEALLNASWFQGPESVRLKYDMWSVGVVMLELILGSPHVFQISDRTRSLLDQHLDGWNEPVKELAYKLRSYMEMCILVPGISPRSHQKNGVKNRGGVWPASWKCSEESFSHQVKDRDPLKLGFPNIWALRLVRQLLSWHPEDRLTVDEALQHAYFEEHT